MSNEDYWMTITTKETPIVGIGALVDEVARQEDPNGENTWERGQLSRTLSTST